MKYRKEGQNWHIILMRILFKNKDVQKLCTNKKYAVKELGQQVALKFFSTINIIQASINLNDILKLPQYKLHKLKGDRKGVYSIYLGAKTGYRLELIPLDDNEKIINVDDMSIYIKAVCIQIERITNHYE